MATEPHIVATKLEPPAASQLRSARPDLVARIPGAARCVAIVAPPGYGKTFLASEIHASCAPGTAAWVSVDLLDRQPYAFWTHVVAALRRTTARIDGEPLALLEERPTSDLTFLAALCEQIRMSADRLLLVLDDVDRIDHPDVLGGIERLGEWCDGRLRLVLTGRVDPALPLARWRTQGSLVELRQDELRFDRAASRRFVSALAPGLLGPDEVDALHDRVEGWPVALQVALSVVGEAADPRVAARDIAGTDRLMADYLTGEVLDALSAAQRDVALGVSVLEWFDVELCREVLGPASVPLVRELRDRPLPILRLAGRDGYRIHSLVRELLEFELRWRDPERHAALHRRAGEALLDRGDRFAAIQHFLAAGDNERAGDVMAGPAIALVDRGQIEELRRALAQLPVDADITGVDRLVDLAFAQLLTGRRSDFERLRRRAYAVTTDDERLQARLRMLAIADRILVGDVHDVRRLVDEDRRRPVSDDDWMMSERRAAIIVRAAEAMEVDDVDEWIDALRRSSAPRPVVEVLAAAMEALVALRRGDLQTALRCESVAADRVGALPSDSHPAMYEALLAGGACAWATGRFERLHELTDRLFTHPFCAFPMMWARAAALAADRSTRIGEPSDALALLDRLAPGDLAGDAVRAVHDQARARALHGAGRYDEVVAVLSRVPASPARDVLLGWAAVRQGRTDEARRLVAGSDRWPTHHRLEAMLVSSLLDASPERLVTGAVDLAARDGWVAPLLGHGSDIDDLVRPLAHRLEPTLAELLAVGPSVGSQAAGRPPSESVLPVALTERETTLLRLLPTHLSYSQMGERLYVSVNTIKSNLKSIYRKLGATNRDEAVRAARAAGLLDAP